MPVCSEDEIVRQFWSGVTAQTKAIYLSHITSPTALQLPVEKICRLAKEAGLLTIIDAAHSPGQIPLDLQALGADMVFGNCHKWMLGVKGAGFLYVRREHIPSLWPLTPAPASRAKDVRKFEEFLELFNEYRFCGDIIYFTDRVNRGYFYIQ